MSTFVLWEAGSSTRHVTALQYTSRFFSSDNPREFYHWRSAIMTFADLMSYGDHYGRKELRSLQREGTNLELALDWQAVLNDS